MKKKLSLFTLFLVMPFVIFGAIQIWWYSQAPHATSVNDTDIMLVERPVPHTNLWFNMAQLRSYTSTGITNLTVSNAYITNIYVITGAVDNITVTNGITNLSLTANTVLKADANKRISSILPNASGVLTNDGAGNVGFFPVTSLGVPNPWTNNTDFTWLSGFTMATNGAPQTAPFSIWTNASFFVGPDVFQDIAQDPNTTHFPYAVLMTDSNGPVALQSSFVVLDSESGSAFSRWFSTVSASQSSATYENSVHNDKLSWHMQGASDFDFSTNTVSIFHINNSGLVTANGYVDSSGNVGDLVAYGTLGRLVSTNVTSIISGLTNIQQNFATTNNSSTLTNIIGAIASNSVPMPVVTAGSGVTVTTNAAGTQTNYSVALTSSSVTVNGTANHITTTSASISLGGSATLDVGSDVALRSAANDFTGSNYFGGAVTTSTNACNGIPDMTQLETLFSTNNTPVFGKPTGVDTTGKSSQWLLIHITNTLASAKAITSEATWSVVGTPWVTNWTDLWLNIYAASKSNAFYIPVN